MVKPLTPWCVQLLVITAAWTAEGLRCFIHVYDDHTCSPQDAVDEYVTSIEECCRIPDAQGYTERNLLSHFDNSYPDCKRCEKPVDGQWSEWSDDGPCSVTCGKGRRLRQRQCESPPPSNGGRPCSVYPMGAVSATNCEGPPCPPTLPHTQTTSVTKIDEKVVSTEAVPDITSKPTPIVSSGVWSEWTACSATCGQATRERLCMGTGKCTGNASSTCHVWPCVMTASADSVVDTPKPTSSFNYFIIAALAGAVILFAVTVLILWRTRVCCFRRKDLHLEALEAASVATYTRRHHVPCSTECSNTKEAALCEASTSRTCIDTSYDSDGYEVPQHLRNKDNSNYDDDSQHIYEDISLLS